MKSKPAAILLLLLALSYSLQAQEVFFQGYAEDVSGKQFGYHSPLPDVESSLLVRGHKDYDPIVWKTEVVPKNYRGKYVSFVWAYGMDVTSNPAEFKLSVNGKEWFVFNNSRTSDPGIKTLNGAGGAELKFNTTMLDVHKDQMGFMTLKLPASTIRSGEPVTLRIDGTPDENMAWYMTFRAGISEGVDINQNLVVVKDNDRLFHSISVDIIHLGAATEATITIGDVRSTVQLETGFNTTDINLPKVAVSTDLIADIQIPGRESIQKSFTLTPVREWEVYLVQHTHTDIGYTRPQTEILPEHLRYIDHALDFCDQTDHLPDAAKFRWTIETSWSVREYLRSRPQAQIDRLLQRLKEGRLEATGMFFNFSEIADESALAAQTKTLRFLKNQGIDVTTAMQNDVNGIAWCMVDYYNNTNVKYLDMGIHAHRARKPFNKPTTFWWQSPAGNRLLSYRSEHYMWGNRLGVHTGQEEVFRANLSNYLKSLEDRDYPYNKISLQFSGYVTDNSPPSTKACYIIDEWNKKYEWPKLRSALASDFLIYLDEQHADEIPAQEVAWPDWWTDGVGSAANETRVTRFTQTEIAATTAIFAMAKLSGQKLPQDLQPEIEDIYDDVLFYDEHTHGAAESVSDPLAQNTINQWGMKSSYAWDGAKRSSSLQEKAMGFVEPVIGRSDVPIIAVFNTLNWTRSNMVELFIQNEILPEGADFTITDDMGREVPAQEFDRRGEGAYYGLWVEDIPPLGYKTFQINVGSAGKEQALSDESESLENEFYKLTIDGKKGIITSIYDKELQRELIDPEDTLSLGQVIYEQLKDRHSLERLTASTRDTVYRPLNEKHSLPENLNVIKVENGAIFKSIWINGKIPVCADDRGVTIEVRLYHHTKKVELLYRLFKLPIYDPEAVYVAFPFHLADGRLAFEAQGGVVYPGRNQLRGTASDWNTIQNYAAVKSDDAQILYVSGDIPLVHFGDLNIGRYYYQLKPKTNHIYSWVMNNYWVTNFKASQKGELRWKYAINSSSDNSHTYATRFGWGERVPVFSRVILPSRGVERAELVSRSFFTIEAANLLLVNTSLSLDEKSIILHLREIEGDHAVLDIRKLKEETNATSIQEVNILEEELATLTSPLMFEHFETKFIRLNLDDK